MAVALALALVGCNRPNGFNPVGPTTVTPSDLLASSHGGGAQRHYKATVSPSSVTAGSSTAISITITNCSDTECSGTSTSSNQQIGSAEITIPAAFVVSGTPSVSPPPGKNWSASVVGGTLRLGANAGNQRLDVGQSLTVTFNATASSCGTATWLTSAYQDTLSAGALVTTTSFSLHGSSPQVEVTGCSGGCTLGQGYWRNHPSAWPVDSVDLGAQNYTATELLAILNQPVAGNGLIQLAHQLIAAKLNVANGAPGAAVAGYVAQADALIGSLVVPPKGAGSLPPSATSTLNDWLTRYNEGELGPGACVP